LNLDKLKQVDKKYWILGLISLVILAFVLVMGPNSGQFKGAINEGTETEKVKCENFTTKITKLKTDSEQIVKSNEEQNELSNYNERAEKLDKMSAFIIENVELSCETLPENESEAILIIKQLDKYIKDLIDIKTELEQDSKKEPQCPLDRDDATDPERIEFLAIEKANKGIKSNIEDLNTKVKWEDKDVKTAENLMFVLSMLSDNFTVDLSDIPQDNIDEIKDSLPNETPQEMVEFINKLAPIYNKLLTEKFKVKACEYTQIPELDGPIECTEGFVYDPSSRVCVQSDDSGSKEDSGTEEKTKSTDENGELDELSCSLSVGSLDDIFTKLISFQDIPESFDEDSWNLIQADIDKLDSKYQDMYADYSLAFLYPEDLPGIITVSNEVLIDLINTGICTESESKTYPSIEVKEKNELDPEDNLDTNSDTNPEDEDPGDPDETETTCPEGASLYTQAGVSVCICDATQDPVESNGSCDVAPDEDPDDDTNDEHLDETVVDPNNDEDPDDTTHHETTLFTCPNGVDQVLDLELCPPDPNDNSAGWVYTCSDGITQVANLNECQSTGQSTNTQTPETPNVYICSDGTTQVSDESECPNMNPSTNTEQDYYEENIYADQNESANDAVVATQADTDNTPSLSTNTNPNIIKSPEVQGDTGPGEWANLFLLFSAFGINFFRKLKLKF